jgi:hypothetical protein
VFGENDKLLRGGETAIGTGTGRRATVSFRFAIASDVNISLKRLESSRHLVSNSKTTRHISRNGLAPRCSRCSR